MSDDKSTPSTSSPPSSDRHAAEYVGTPWHWPTRWAEVRSVLDEVADRMDEHAYSELSSLLDDGPAEPEHPWATVVEAYLTNAGIVPESLRYAATHESLCRSWIFDLLMGLADTIDSATRPASTGGQSDA